jgi:hypothetical protein
MFVRGMFVRARIRRWVSGLLVFVGCSVAVHGADIQISNPLRNRGFAVVLQGDRIVFRNGAGRPVTSLCMVWQLSGGTLDPSRMTHTINQVRENWDELRDPIVPPGGSLSFTLADNPDIAESAMAAAHAVVSLDTVIVDDHILGPHHCPAATDLEAKRKAKRDISRRFLACRGSAQDRIDWLREQSTRAADPYERAVLDDLLYRMEKWGAENAEQMARRSEASTPALVEESR